ncbi:entry exclusion protein TrbK [uncultured Paracoccus sp.]|uniref:entry exclusion protein TrbK n=1 Tax=uncultured Paracoccus sp. TaxID=189685 RepID=UPI002626335C|nr:entry exclusion protein TrbK [uncultured Paracoccus sp.]
MSRFVIIAVIIVGVTAASVAAWMFLPVVPQDDTAVTPTAAQPETDAERREHRTRFFGGDPERDVRGGQEMRPRW